MFSRMLRPLLPLALLVVVATPAWGQPASAASQDDQALADPTRRAGRSTKPYLSPQIFIGLEQEKSLPNIHVLDVVQDEQGFLWFATQSGGLVRYDGYQMRVYAKDETSRHPLPTSFITALEIDRQGRLWIGTGDLGIIIYDPTTDTFTERPNYQDEEAEGTQTRTGITVLFKDRAGTIWIGADNGVLSHYEQETDTFEHTRIFQDLEADVTAIVQSQDDKLWVGTGTAGLFKLDPEKKSVIGRYLAGPGDKELSSNYVRALAEDTAGTLWIGTQNGLDRLDPKQDTLTHFRNQRSTPTVLTDNRVTAIFQARDGKLWVGTENGVNMLNGDGKSFTRYQRDTANSPTTASFPILVSAIYQDRADVLYFATQSRVRKVPPLRLKLNPFESGSWGHDVMTFEDGDEPGVFWAGTYSSGLQKFDRNAQEITVYTHLGDPQNVDSVNITSWIMTVHRDQRGLLWFGGNGMGLVRFDPKTEQYEQYLPDPENMAGPTSDEIHDIVQDESGFLWLGTWGGGLNRFDPEEGTFIEFMSDKEDPTSLSDDYLYALHIDNKDPNVLWVGTGRGGLNRFDMVEETATQYSLAPEGVDSYGYSSIQTIHQDEKGVLWLGTAGAGIIRFDPKSQQIEYLSKKDGLPHNSIYGILADDNGHLWISTNGGGMAVYDPEAKKLTVYTAADGLIGNEFFQNGYHKLKTGEMLFSQSGGLYGYGGFNLFHPRDIQPDTYVPPVVITGFQIFNEETSFAKPIWTMPDIDLGYTDSVFSFEFSALSYKAPGQIRYSYKMDGLHDWVETNRRFVTYTNLDGGDYVFRVKASETLNEWGDAQAVLKITVASPPWKTWWAYMIYGLIGLGAAFGYMRYQARKVESMQQAHRLESVERELELTGAVQSGFLPKTNQVNKAQFNLYGFYRPADQAGGDWWWYEESESKLTILVGDVTGHGAGPAMVTAAAATAFRVQGKNPSMSIEDRMAICNEEVLRVGGGIYQMTMSAIELDGQTGRFAFYSAGGQPILRIRYDGRPRTLPCPGTPLGSENFSMGKVEGTMTAGERMVIYTDGIPEMPVGPNRELGMRRFSMICESTQGLNIAEAAQRVVMVSDAIRQNAQQRDDWTFAVVEWPGGEGAPRSAGASQSIAPPQLPLEETQDWSETEQGGEGSTQATAIGAWTEPSKLEDETRTSGGPGRRRS